MPRNGEPSVATEAIRSGRRAAAERASMPPRLCPTRCTGRPVAARAASIVTNSRSAMTSRHSAFRPTRESSGR